MKDDLNFVVNGRPNQKKKGRQPHLSINGRRPQGLEN
jgi:hypothetical protein